MKPTPLIEFRQVKKAFSGKEVLNGCDLNIYQGEITTIIGKSGVGKSVLLKHIIGLIKPDAGEVLFEGQPLLAMSKKAKKALKSKFSYMFQGTALFDSMTVFENIALPLSETTNIPPSEIKNRVQNKMDHLDIKDIGLQYPSQLSGGMKKRVALARALVTDPEIILFDEPTTGLDPVRKNAVHAMISDYQAQFGFTGVVVSHEIPDIFYISQNIAMLHEGRILYQGGPEDLQQSSDTRIQNFIHGLETRHDTLTGTATQRQLEKRFDEEMSRLKRHQTNFSIILFTFTNLEEIKSKGGQIAGQYVLKNFIDEVRHHIRLTDICSRYGLEKVMVVLPNTNFDQVNLFCSKLSQILKGNQIATVMPYPGFCFYIQAGFVEAKEGDQLNTVVAQAEERMLPFYEFEIC